MILMTATTDSDCSVIIVTYSVSLVNATTDSDCNVILVTLASDSDYSVILVTATVLVTVMWF